MISRFPKNIGLFCKRAPLKRFKETIFCKRDLFQREYTHYTRATHTFQTRCRCMYIYISIYLHAFNLCTYICIHGNLHTAYTLYTRTSCPSRTHYAHDVDVCMCTFTYTYMHVIYIHTSTYTQIYIYVQLHARKSAHTLHAYHTHYTHDADVFISTFTCIYIIMNFHIYTHYTLVPHTLQPRFLMQNIVSLIGLFCKRDLEFSICLYTHTIHAYHTHYHTLHYHTHYSHAAFTRADCGCYGVATVSRIDKIIRLYCRISSLLQGSFAKETYVLIDPTDRSLCCCQ